MVFHLVRIGFIGAGSMGEALINGLLNSGTYRPEEICCYDIAVERLRQISERYGVLTQANNSEVAGVSDVIILAVKPDIAERVVTEIKERLTPGKLLLSIVAGLSTEALEKWVGREVPVVRVMPNTPCLLGKGISAVALGKFAHREHEVTSHDIFSCVGETVAVPEKLMNAVTGVSGSGPAYIYLVIEALTDASVALGIPRDIAGRLVLHTVIGAAEMDSQTGRHPAVLKAQVVSPGGTTAAGLNELEEGSIRSLFARAVAAASRRADEIGQ